MFLVPFSLTLTYSRTRSLSLSLTHTSTLTHTLSHSVNLDHQTKGMASEHANFSLVTKLEAISGGEYQIYK